MIRLDIVDSITSSPATAGSTVMLEGTNTTYFEDSVTIADTSSSPKTLFWNESDLRPGSYRLTVRKPGYRDWQRDEILLRDGRCHLGPFQQFIARLQR